MKRSLAKSLSWSLMLAWAVAVGTASCTPEERNFGNQGGSGGAGGDGGSTMACKPDTEEPCYTGPMGTLEVGLCKSGLHICLPSGNGFGECGGEVLPAAEDCLTPADEACNGNDVAECPSLSDGWLKAFGTVNFSQVVQDVAITDKGEIVVVGSFANRIDFGLGPMESTGSEDIFVAKFDERGNALWSKRYGDAASQEALAVAVDKTGAIYVGGAMSGSVDFDGNKIASNGSAVDAFLARFDADGKSVWAHNFGDLNRQFLREIAITSTNLIVVAGNFGGTIEFDTSGVNKHTSAGSDDIFVARFNTSGDVAGSRRFGGQGNETVRGMTLDSTDRVYITGGFSGLADFEGIPIMSTGGIDAYLAMLAPDLKLNDVRSFGNPNSSLTQQEGFDVAVDPNDGLYFTGVFVDSIDLPGQVLSNPDLAARTLYLMKFAPMLGMPELVQQFGGKNGDMFNVQLAIDPNAKQLVLGGSFTGEVNFGGGSPLLAEGGSDLYFAKLTFDGAFVAQRSLLSIPMAPEPNSLLSLALLPSGDLVFGGMQSVPITFGAGTVGEADGQTGNALLGRLVH